MNKYRDGIRSETEFALPFLGRLQVLLTGKVKVLFSVETENEVGNVSEATFGFQTGPLFKRKPKITQGEAEIREVK